jgi:protein O-GlcNAc transferase
MCASTGIQKMASTPRPGVTPEENPLLTAVNLQQQGKADEAEALFRQILGVAPTNPVALYSLTVILLNSGRHQEALLHASAGVQANPDFFQLWFVQGAVQQALDRWEEALASFDRALLANPWYIEALVYSGAVLRDLHRRPEAMERFQRVLNIDPNDETALGNFGFLLTEFGLGQQAVAIFERLLRKNPGFPYGLGLLCYERLRHCDWTDLDAATDRITEGIRHGERTCKALAYMAFSDSASDHYRCARIYAQGQFPLRPEPLWRGESYLHARKRIAYVSPDLREHPVGHLLAGVIEAHDQSRFETIGISLGVDDDSRIGARLRAAFEHFIDAKDMPPRQIAEVMREMEVDIAIDLAGCTRDSRTEVFLSRPAPIQINYLGYPGTMGLDCYDYILADRTVIPEEHQAWFAEKPAYLDHCYLPMASGVEVAEPLARSAYGLPEKGFVFCAFSHDYKIHPRMFAIWMRLLDTKAGSVLWLVSRNELSQQNLRQAAQAHGVAPDRLVFASRVPRVEDHLARYRVADLFLDTWPYNAHTTAADALLAGLPVITCQGGAFPSRVASSLLETLGFGELVTRSFEEFFDLANGLAHNSRRLKALKQRLSPKALQGHPFLGQSFTRSLERVLDALEVPAVTPPQGVRAPAQAPLSASPSNQVPAGDPGAGQSEPILALALDLFRRGNLPQAEIYARQCLLRDGGNAAAAELIAELRQAYGLPASFVLSERAPLVEGRGNRYLVIKAWGYEFWSEAHHLASQLLLAELTQRTPVVHWGCNCLYRREGDVDASRHFFQQISPFRLEDLPPTATIYPPKWSWDNLHEENINKWKGEGSRLAAQFLFARPETLVVSDFYSTISSIRPWIGRSSRYYGLTEDELYSAMFQKYLKPVAGIANRVAAFFNRHMRGRPWVGVHAPGPGGVGESPGATRADDTPFDFIDRIVELNPTTGIFLMAEGRPVIDGFRKRYRARLLCARAARTASSTGSPMSGPDGIAVGAGMLVDALLATTCDYFIGHQGSTASLAIGSLRGWPEGFMFLLGESSLRGENLVLHDRLPH